MRQVLLAYRPAFHERSLALAHLLASLHAGKTLCGRRVEEDWDVTAATHLPVGVCTDCRRRSEERA